MKPTCMFNVLSNPLYVGRRAATCWAVDVGGGIATSWGACCPCAHHCGRACMSDMEPWAAAGLCYTWYVVCGGSGGGVRLLGWCEQRA